VRATSRGPRRCMRRPSSATLSCWSSSRRARRATKAW